MSRLIPILGIAALAASCAQDIQPPRTFVFDRPSAISLGCWGDMRVTNGDPADPSQEIVRSAMPASACASHEAGSPPEGQEEIEGEASPQSFFALAFILQPTLGSVMLAQRDTELGTLAVLDADPFTPGQNAVPVGTGPVDIATSVDGCHVFVPNAGSCDLSILDVDSSQAGEGAVQVSRVLVESSGGERILARPHAIVAEPQDPDRVGFTCPDTPQGLTYIAYPDCNWVAAIEPATGQAVAGIRFGDGTVEITDGAVSCPDQCGDGAVDTSARAEFGGPGRPVALDMAADGERLYIGAENLNAITIVELDGDRLPASVSQVPLDGEVGVLRVSVTGPINMGGSTGLGSGSAGESRYAYAVATDATVRVVDVDRKMVECDTQVDPRYLHDVTDVGFLSCMPVGDVATPPRRPEARSPGIHIPRIREATVQDWEAIPLDVAFQTIDNTGGEPNSASCPGGGDISYCPIKLVGHFAFIGTASGSIFLANVDDDFYPDFERADEPWAVHLPLALSHQLRDAGGRREAPGFTELDDGTIERTCGSPTQEGNQYGPRAQAVTRVSTGRAPNKYHLAPSTQVVTCDPRDPDMEENPLADVAVSALAWGAGEDRREKAFPDLFGVRNEILRITWEGLVSEDTTDVVIDGPATRQGVLEVDGGISLVDHSRPFCRAGMQPYDIADLVGCDPSFGDAGCGLDETCFVHPETPESQLTSGACLPQGQTDALLETCRDFLVSERRYSVVSTHAGELELVPRRRALDATPVAGCESADQCDALYRKTVEMAADEHPFQIEAATCDEEVDTSCPRGYVCQGTDCVLAEQPTWSCEEDPSRQPGKSWCVMTCEASADCTEGSVCEGGYCVEGPTPPAECLTGLQRYQLRVGEAFTVLSNRRGFLHNRIVDEATGECIDDPAGNPLFVGRVPLDPPACTGDDFTDVTPNPCATTVEHLQPAPQAMNPDAPDDCFPIDDELPPQVLVDRPEEPAIRVQTPGVRFHLTNLETRGDAVCAGDLAGDGPAFPTVDRNGGVAIDITGGGAFLILATVKYPIALVNDASNGMWVADQGDQQSDRRGDVYRITPPLSTDGTFNFSEVRIAE